MMDRPMNGQLQNSAGPMAAPKMAATSGTIARPAASCSGRRTSGLRIRTARLVISHSTPPALRCHHRPTRGVIITIRGRGKIRVMAHQDPHQPRMCFVQVSLRTVQQNNGPAFARAVVPLDLLLTELFDLLHIEVESERSTVTWPNSSGDAGGVHCFHRDSNPISSCSVSPEVTTNPCDSKILDTCALFSSGTSRSVPSRRVILNE
mmetsp:Transcript_66918/g.112008  ORF Transcript_66918/g.112008 Transcript_66918/m.112008 type:complete len:206 (+) Transcript_66918:73-690(+)